MLAAIKNILQSIKDCITALVEGDDLATAKLCLIEDGINGACPVVVPQNGLTKNETGGTLVLDGDVTANFPANQEVNLQNANNASCGEATVESSTYNEETGKTTVTLSACDLDDGKTAADIVSAKPVTAIVKAAIKTVKAFAVRKAVVKKVIKEEVAERG